jgi:hypothetical protein
MLPPPAADTTPDKPRFCKLSRFLLDLSKRILLQAGREKPIICRGFFFQPSGSIGDSKMQSILQSGRNLTDSGDGFLKGKRYLLMDRDKKYDKAFLSTLAGSGVDPVRLPPKLPNLNAHIDK